MRIGIVCPYSFDVPGGVQFHVRDLAEHFIGHGHEVSRARARPTTTPRCRATSMSAGRAVPVPLQRLGGPAELRPGHGGAGAAAGSSDGEFDVLHLHEPVTPSVSLLALWAAEGPIVATFHTSNLRSRAMQAAYPPAAPQPGEDRRRGSPSPRTPAGPSTTHVGGDAVVIPNGVYVDRFASADAPAAVAGHRWRADDRLPRPDRRAAQGTARPRRRHARRSLREVPRRRGCWSSARATRRPPASAWPPEVRGSQRVPRRGQRRGQGAAAAPRSTSTSRRTPAARASASSWSRRWRRAPPCVASDLPAFLRVLDGGRAGATFRSEDAEAPGGTDRAPGRRPGGRARP